MIHRLYRWRCRILLPLAALPMLQVTGCDPAALGIQTGTSAALGLTLGVPPRKLLMGLALGAALWAIVITGAVLLGVVGSSPDPD